MSTNKVYGDAPNEMPLVELETRWDYADPADYARRSTRRCASTAPCTRCSARRRSAADVMAQEYGRYFGLNVGVFRGGCLTGPASLAASSCTASSSYLVKAALTGDDVPHLRLQGQAGPRQHPLPRRAARRSTLLRAPRARRGLQPRRRPRRTAARSSRPSALVEELGGGRLKTEYVEQNRVGDHICYISDLRKLQARLSRLGDHHPAATDPRREMIEGWKSCLAAV